MREYIDATRVASSALLLRHSGKSILIVEGPTDQSFFAKVVHCNCTVTFGEDKRNVEGALALLDRWHVKGVLGVVDLDYDWVLGRTPESRNVVTTHVHDLETLLMTSKAVRGVLHEYADPELVEKFESDTGRTVLDACFESGFLLGLLRLYNAQHRLSWTFSTLDVEACLDQRLHLDYERILTGLAQSSNVDAGARRVLDDLWASRGATYRTDLLRVCQGHDLVRILRFGLNHLFGNVFGKRVSVASIQSGLRIGCEVEWIERTELYKRVRAWELRNPPFRVLASVV